jgi:hypothetical protein
VASESVGKARLATAWVPVKEKASSVWDSSIRIIFPRSRREIRLNVSDQIVLDLRIKGHCVQVPAWAGDSLIPRDRSDVWPINGGGPILLFKQTVERLASVSVDPGLSY